MVFLGFHSILFEITRLLFLVFVFCGFFSPQYKTSKEGSTGAAVSRLQCCLTAKLCPRPAIILKVRLHPRLAALWAQTFTASPLPGDWTPVNDRIQREMF